VTRAAALLGAPLWLAAAVAPQTAPAPVSKPASMTASTTPSMTATQKIAVDVRGPVALVTVTREVVSDGPGDTERLLDLALPAHAALVDVAFEDAGKWRPAEAKDHARAVKEYVDRLEERGLVPTREPFDDATTYRIRLAGGGRAPALARYSYALLPETVDGRHRIRFPSAPERTPAGADVVVTVAGGADVVIAGERASGGRAARGHATARGAWEISWAPRARAAPRAALEGSLAFAKLSAVETLAAVSVEAGARPPQAPPPSLLLLVDRSRSVGLPGLAAERDLAGRLLEALPPSTRFDALFFDRQTKRLFPMSRPATREALSALEAEMVPDRLQNGTDLAGALREAGALLRREASAFTPRTWLAIVTDGALPEAPAGVDAGAALDHALGAVPGVEITALAFIVRPKGDDAAPATAERALRRLAAAHGGVVRALAADELDEGLASALAALAKGGDVAGVRVVVGGGEHAFTDRLAPGEGQARLFRLAALGRAPALVTGTAGGGTVRATLRPLRVDAAWLRALEADDFGTRLVATDGLVALVEHGPEVIRASDTVRGSLDRTVVRNTLSLAYMPRARACYLNRTAATPALRDLTGRVRLAIDLTRGEVGDVVVQSSTLNHPGIEECLRDGAFSIEVPRALRSDAPSTAVLNLVFRPRTPEKRETPEEAALGEQIDLVIEELRRSEPPTLDESPPVDRSMIPTR
jgi:hypothetical protein